MIRRIPFVLVVGAVLAALPAPTVAQSSGMVIRVPVTGVVELGLAPFIERSIEEAAASGAAAVILDMDTPGGRVDAAERISDALSDSPVPVYTLVNRRAYSAGALIALSTDRIYMRPGSVMGAATPVDGSGTKASEKIVSAMRSQMRALAEDAELDPEVAAAMVDEDIEIEGVTEAGKLLTLTTEEAVDLGYAEEIEDLSSLIEEIGVAGATVTTAEANWAERVVRFFSNPVVAPFLLSLGFLGLLTEIKTPSFGLAGGAGILALSLFFGSHLIIGLAGLEDLIIFGVGLALIGVEVLLIPGFGIFGLLGGIGVMAGLYLSMLGGLPTSPDFTRAGMVLSTTVLLIVVSAWVVIRTLPGSSRLARSGILLTDTTDTEIGYESAETRVDLIGLVGKAITDLRPAGTALFGDERIDVVSESEWVTEGTPVKVVSAEGYRHVVRAVDHAELNEGTPTEA
ncbi:MAG: ATP-dependent Clp protease proteolytic subunit [Gemmatimonadota bacterium]|nr:ATP-dependent Clp protease proteolytic subunit [Gemmatimonadota bacterium]MDE3006657.1 ATP-dependent Clp protease proteolytic subunit [Gemmatimonadota bacterium]MDE3014910.1 ATP-dependent Clp protease proteolytic subunit [Gemmatimonadota bacterium]